MALPRNQNTPFPPLPNDWQYGYSKSYHKYYFWETGSKKSVFKHPTTNSEYDNKGVISNTDNHVPTAPKGGKDSIKGFTEFVLTAASEEVPKLDNPTVERIITTLGQPLGQTHEENIKSVLDLLSTLQHKLTESPITPGKSRISSSTNKELAALCMALRIDVEQSSFEKLIENLSAYFKKNNPPSTSHKSGHNTNKENLPFPPLPENWYYRYSKSHNKYYFWKKGDQSSDFKHPTTKLEYDAPLKRHKAEKKEMKNMDTLQAMGYEPLEISAALDEFDGDFNQAQDKLYKQRRERERSPEKPLAQAPQHSSQDKETEQAMKFVRQLKALNQQLTDGDLNMEEYEVKWNTMFTDMKRTTTKNSGKQVDMQLGGKGQPQESRTPQHARIEKLKHIPPPPASEDTDDDDEEPPTPSTTALNDDRECDGLLRYDKEHVDPCPHLLKGAAEGTLKLPKAPLCFYTSPPLRRGGVVSPPQGEPATRYLYDFKNRRWCSKRTKVRVDAFPFQEGTMRLVFHMKELSQPMGARQDFVAKISKDPHEHNQSYFLDVEMQALAGFFAAEFNKRNPPKPVKFLEASVMECPERVNNWGTRVVFGIEPFIAGEYVKHSNNYGWISEHNRNTPQAFSHFTHWLSKGNLLVADIQGVDDMYTDPQVHSRMNVGFGKGNMGGDGIWQFFNTHGCNEICKQLKLPMLTCKENDGGTVCKNAKLGTPPIDDFDEPAELKELGLGNFALGVAQAEHFDKRREMFQAAAQRPPNSHGPPKGFHMSGAVPHQPYIGMMVGEGTM